MGLGSSPNAPASEPVVTDVNVENTDNNTDTTTSTDAATATANAVASAAEGDAEKKKQKRKQVKHPLLRDADGNPQKLTEMPEDFNLGDHKPLIRKDFEDETIWLEWRAGIYEAKAKDYRDEAALIRQFGSAEERKAAEKLMKVRKQFEKLKADLAGQDIDVEAILAQASDNDSAE